MALKEGKRKQGVNTKKMSLGKGGEEKGEKGKDGRVVRNYKKAEGIGQRLAVRVTRRSRPLG
jgi:hypothetical protein